MHVSSEYRRSEIFVVIVNDLSRWKLNMQNILYVCACAIAMHTYVHANVILIDLYQFLSLSLPMKIRLRKNFTSEIFYQWKYLDLRYLKSCMLLDLTCTGSTQSHNYDIYIACVQVVEIDVPGNIPIVLYSS